MNKCKLHIDTEKGIADLVVLVQNQRIGRKPYSDEFGVIIPDNFSEKDCQEER